MPDTINARIPLCGLSVFVHSITLRKASANARKITTSTGIPGLRSTV